jgi:hypothetical protein
MATKKDRLIERAEATRRLPKPERLTDATSSKKGYRVVAVSLYTPESEWIDHITQVLQRAGVPKANRSLVVREAILELQEALKEKDPQEVSRHFMERYARRRAEVFD